MEREEESGSPAGVAEAWPVLEERSCVREAPSAPAPSPASRLPGAGPAGMGGRSDRDWEPSGDDLPDWKGGWNTLTENLQGERQREQRGTERESREGQRDRQRQRDCDSYNKTSCTSTVALAK